MSQFQFPCPKCQQPVLCEDEYRGMDLMCPHCNSQIAAPPAAGPPATPGKTGSKLGMTASHEPAPHPVPIVPMLEQPRRKGLPAWVKPAIAAVVVCAAGAVLYVHPEYIKWAEVKVGLAKPEPVVDTNTPAVLAGTDTNAVPEVTNSPPAVWSLALGPLSIPNYPAKGTIMDAEFTVDNARIDGSTLSLIQGPSAGILRRYIIRLKLQPGDTLEGQKFSVEPGDKNGVPQLTRQWRPDVGKPFMAKNYTSGYAMKLEFGNILNGKLPGKIYLSDPDDEHSFVAGAFEAVTKQPASPMAAAQQPPPNQPPSRGRNRPGGQGQPGGAPPRRMPRPTTGVGNAIPF